MPVSGFQAFVVRQRPVEDLTRLHGIGGRCRLTSRWRGRGLRRAFKILPQRLRAECDQIVIADRDRLDDTLPINEKRRGNGPHIAEGRGEFFRRSDGIIDSLPLDERLEHRIRLN